MIARQTESKTRRRTYTDEKGNPLLSVSVQCEYGNVYFHVERLDRDYCDAHPEEVQEAVSGFLPEANELLKAEDMPQLR